MWVCLLFPAAVVENSPLWGNKGHFYPIPLSSFFYFLSLFHTAISHFCPFFLFVLLFCPSFHVFFLPFSVYQLFLSFLSCFCLFLFSILLFLFPTSSISSFNMSYPRPFLFLISLVFLYFSAFSCLLLSFLPYFFPVIDPPFLPFFLQFLFSLLFFFPFLRWKSDVIFHIFLFPSVVFKPHRSQISAVSGVFLFFHRRPIQSVLRPSVGRFPAAGDRHLHEAGLSWRRSHQLLPGPV